MVDKIKELRELTGVGLNMCKQAIEYSNGDTNMAVAYIKAKTIAITTHKLTFNERVKMFLENK